MKLICVNTGSKAGNSYILESSDGEKLLLDLGAKIDEIQKALGYSLKGVIGACVTHHHKDHSKSIEELEPYIPIYKPYIDTKPMRFKSGSNWKISSIELTDLDGNFCHTDADGEPCKCYGFYIYHPEMGTMVYITDTEFVKWRFRNLNHILISCNYQKKYIDDSNMAKRKHVLKGHMELETVKKFVESNCTDDLKNIILCHLSDDSANPSEMVAEIQKVARFGNVDVSSKGKKWDFDLLPF